jgi:hypothetical protein
MDEVAPIATYPRIYYTALQLILKICRYSLSPSIHIVLGKGIRNDATVGTFLAMDLVRVMALSCLCK